MISWGKTGDARIKKREGRYWARFSKKNKRVEASLGTKNFEVAKRLVDEIEAKIHLGKSWKLDKQLFRRPYRLNLYNKLRAF